MNKEHLCKPKTKLLVPLSKIKKTIFIPRVYSFINICAQLISKTASTSSTSILNNFFILKCPQNIYKIKKKKKCGRTLISGIVKYKN